MDIQNNHLYYMHLALKEAQQAMEHNDVPVGAVIVRDGNILAKTHNQVELLNDPTAHAEILAITQAAATLKDKHIVNATLYVTLEPCAMCAGAIILSRIPTLFYGAHDAKMGACGSRFDTITASGLNHYVNVSSGLASDESESLLKHFFRNIRKEQKKDD